MKVTENMQDFNVACLDTPFGAIGVKKQRYSGLGNLNDFGVLIEPAIMQGPLAKDELDIVMAGYTGTVKVRGHGWMIPKEIFVWTGTAKEFKETWVID